LANKIDRQVKAQQETNVKLAQRRAYREALVQNVEAAESAKEVVAENKQPEGFLKTSQMTNEMKQAFAAKAIAEGFPIEYVNARLGETSAPEVDNLSDIKNVLASGLETNVKVAAASSMIKVATLSDADYSRIIDYWKNELGYGDQEWIDALFTKKYDKK